MQFLNFIRLKKIIQPKLNTKNRSALKTLRTLGFEDCEIRRALMRLNRVRLRDLAEAGGGQVSIPTLHNTIVGIRTNRKAMAIFARRLGLEPAELFKDMDID